MSHAATLPRPDTVSITVSGPSTALAYARALAAKARGWAGAVVTHVTMAIRTITRIPRAVANVALSALSTRIGYDTVTTVVGKATRFLGRLASSAIRYIGRGLRKAARGVTRVVRHVAPRIADATDRAIDTVATAADAVMTTIETTVTGVSQILGALVRSPLVVVSTIRAAGIASAALAVHALTKGAAAARLVRAIPSAMTLVVWATSPWKLLAAVAGVMVAAMGYAAIRLGRATAPTPTDPTPDWDVVEGDDSWDGTPRDTSAFIPSEFDESWTDDFAAASADHEAVIANGIVAGPGPEASLTPVGALLNEEVESGAPLGHSAVAMSPTSSDAAAQANESEGDLTAVVAGEPSDTLGTDSTSHSEEVSTLAANLRVVIAVDGSIEVHGIPASLPEDEQRRIAQTAADAAAQQLRRIVKRGRPLRSADRRNVTKTAQAAVRATLESLAPVAA